VSTSSKTFIIILYIVYNFWIKTYMWYSLFRDGNKNTKIYS